VIASRDLRVLQGLDQEYSQPLRDLKGHPR